MHIRLSNTDVEDVMPNRRVAQPAGSRAVAMAMLDLMRILMLCKCLSKDGSSTDALLRV
jgi:hypothetical protein